MTKQSNFTLHEFSNLNSDRNKSVFTECADFTPNDFALAATGPVGYIGHLLSKRERGDDITNGEIFEEIADALIYLDLLCTSLNGDLAVVLARKFNQTSKKVGCNHKLIISGS